MEKKIIQYVNYQFRFDKREDLEELKAEIIANLIDRYYENVNLGKNPEEAYVFSIKSMGNFADNSLSVIPDIFSVKPSIPDILLICGAILSVFGFILTLFNPIIGTLGTALSILLFSGSAYYLYNYSQYVRKEQMDIEKHNILLSKIFKYMKTSFAFWSLSLSYIFSSLAMKIIISIFITSLNNNLKIRPIGSIITGYFVIFSITLIIFLLIFRNIYLRLINHYYLLTGDSNLQGKIRESFNFLYDKDVKLPQVSFIASTKFYPLIGLILILPLMLVPCALWIDFYNSFGSSGQFGPLIIHLFTLLSTKYELISLITLISLLICVVLIFWGILRNNKVPAWIYGLFYYLSFILTTVLTYVIPPNKDAYVSIELNYPGPYAIIALIVFTFLVFKRRKALSRK